MSGSKWRQNAMELGLYAYNTEQGFPPPRGYLAAQLLEFPGYYLTNIRWQGNVFYTVRNSLLSEADPLAWLEWPFGDQAGPFPRNWAVEPDVLV